MEKPTLQEINLHDFKFDFGALTHDFVSVKLRDILPGRALPCDMYFPAANGLGEELRMEKIFARGRQCTENFRHTFTEEEVKEVYIRAEDEITFLEYLGDSVRKLIDSPEVPTAEKTRLLYDNAESVIRRVFHEHPNKSNILLARQLIDNFASHLLREQVTVQALLSLFSKDYYTFTHCVQVAALAMAFSKYIGWSSEEITDLGLGALLHDIGKNSIPDKILNKPESLEKEEYETIKKHPALGYQQLRDSKLLSQGLLDVVLYHHESMDGKGYPHGLWGNQIPRYARVAHIIDCFDALISRRTYKGALSDMDALALMKTQMRTSFDPELLDAFLKFLGMRGQHGSRRRAQPVVELGTQMVFQAENELHKVKVVVVGLEPGNCFILKEAGPLSQWDYFQEGKRFIARHTHRGTAYGFKATVLGRVAMPLPLIFVSYPDEVETISLRRDLRVECFFPAEIEVRGRKCRCVIVDLSSGGCRIGINNAERAKLPPVLGDEAISINSQFPGRDEAVLFEGVVRNVGREQNQTFLGIQIPVVPAPTAQLIKFFIEGVLQLMG